MNTRPPEWIVPSSASLEDIENVQKKRDHDESSGPEVIVCVCVFGFFLSMHALANAHSPELYT